MKVEGFEVDGKAEGKAEGAQDRRVEGVGVGPEGVGVGPNVGEAIVPV